MDSDSHALEEKFLDEMVRGYLDGRNPDNPEPSQNRSRSYVHGFANGRDDLVHSPRALAQTLREMADAAIAAAIAWQPFWAPVESRDKSQLSALLDAFVAPDIDLLLFADIAKTGEAGNAFADAVDWAAFEAMAAKCRVTNATARPTARSTRATGGEEHRDARCERNSYDHQD